MSATEHAETNGTTVPIVMSPLPVVWGICMAGEFWWSVELDRYCMRHRDPRIIDLFAGTFCDEHGMEGTMVGTTGDLRSALGWVCGGPRPLGAAVH